MEGKEGEKRKAEVNKGDKKRKVGGRKGEYLREKEGEIREKHEG